MQKKTFVVSGVVAAALALSAMPALAQSDGAGAKLGTIVSPDKASQSSTVTPKKSDVQRTHSTDQVRDADAAPSKGDEAAAAVGAVPRDSAASVVLADTVKPTATLVSPSAGLVSGLDIQVDAQDAQGLDRITANIYQDGVLVKSTSTRVDGQTTGSHNATVKLPDGTYTIRYNASDVAGNIASTGNYTVTLDTVGPTVTLKEGAKPGEKSFKLYDAGQIDRLTVNGVEKDLTDNTWSDLNGVRPGVFGAVEGQNTLVVFDKAGNSTTHTFLLDTVKPTATLVSPSAGLVSGLDIQVDAQDAQGLDRITANIYQDGVLVKSTSTRVDGQTTGSHNATVKLPDGTYTIRYNASDVAGNIASTGNYTVTLDTVGPTVTLKEGAKPGEKSFKLYDAGQIDRLTVNGVEKDLTDNTWSDLNGVRPGVFGAVEGQNTLVVFDKAGNSTTHTFLLDTVKPTATLVSPSAGLVSGLDIQVDAQDAQGLDRITANIYQDGVLVKSTSTRVDGQTTGSHNATVKLPDGTYTIRYNASDVAGNIASTGNYTVTLDTVGPTVTLKEGAKPGEKSFKLYDAGQIDRLTVNGVEKDLTDNTWSDLNGVRPGVFGAVEGQNTLVVFDKAGNSTTHTFVLDSVDPKVTNIEQVYQEKEGGRMAVTLTFSEPLAAAPGQGWYGTGTTYTKVYYSPKTHTVAFRDIAGNAGSYTFTVDPIGEHIVPIAEETIDEEIDDDGVRAR